MLNILLLLVGSLMDIFSAIIVFVPLLAPLGEYFGIDPDSYGNNIHCKFRTWIYNTTGWYEFVFISISV